MYYNLHCYCRIPNTMPAKLTYEQVKSAFKQRCFKLLSRSYESNTTLLDYKCNNGHIHRASYKYFTKNLPCLDCQKETTKAKQEEKELERKSKPRISLKGVPKKFNLEFVRDFMNRHGCELLSTDYTTDRIKLKFICVCGGIGEQSFNRFYHAGSRCNNRQCIQQRMESKMLEKYNVTHAMHSEHIKAKAKITNLEKYGVENPFSNEQIKQKIKQTNLEKYGVEYASQSEIVQAKIKSTNLKVYGCENVFASKEIQERIKLSNFNNYGVEWNGQREDVKTKIQNIFLERYGTICPLNTPYIQERIRKDCFDRYGVEHHASRPDVIQKRKITTLDNYGVEYSLQSPLVREKAIKRLLDLYGVDNISKHPLYQRKKVETSLVKYGCEHPMQHEPIKEKGRETSLMRYGCEYPMQHEPIKERGRETSLMRYGCEYPIQNPVIAEKASHISRKFKDYTLPSGNIVRIQGYEDKVLDHLLQIYKEDQVLTKRTEMPDVWYLDDGKYRRYYPDFYIPNDNLIIEVKSTYTYRANITEFHRKRKACEYLGYRFKSYICKSRKHDFEELYV